MARIIIERGGGWTDRFRAYDVWIDGRKRGAVKANRTEPFDVESGLHDVQLRIGLMYSSPGLAVETDNADVLLTCRPRAIPGLAALALVQPDRWIILEPKTA